MRRPVAGAHGSPDTKGRGGCLLTGAILGIIVGATFAFYGLPPILKHFYGEKHIAAGASYTEDAKVIRVTGTGSLPEIENAERFSQRGSTWVTLSVTTNKTWTPALTDFSLQFDGVESWVPAASAVSGSQEALQFPLAEERSVSLSFPVPNGDATPKYLHVADPRIRFELPEATR